MEIPTCGVVIRKEGDREEVCTNPASTLYSITNPDDNSQVQSVVLVCKVHDQSLEEGHPHIVVSDDGKDRIAIQLNQEEINNVTEPTSPTA